LPSDLTVLSFDTSAAHCAAGLLCGNDRRAETLVEMSRGQAEALFPLIETMLTSAGVAWSDLDLIAVGTGPGNFTGTRISVSAARGLSLALGVPAMGITAFEMMRGPGSFRDKRPALVSLAAPRGDFHLQAFENGQAVGRPQQISPGTSPDALACRSAEVVIGYRAEDVADQLNRLGLCDRALTAMAATISAAGPTIARIATDKWQAGLTTPPRPAPVYVRTAAAAPPRQAPPVILP